MIELAKQLTAQATEHIKAVREKVRNIIDCNGRTIALNGLLNQNVLVTIKIDFASTNNNLAYLIWNPNTIAIDSHGSE